MQKIFIFFVLTFFGLSLFAQEQEIPDSSGLPGDQFSLSGAMALFKSSTSPEEFEKALNSETSHISNLDLDEDGNTDYVKVISKVDSDIQLIIMQIAVSESELQDIGVFEIEKTGNETATLQLLGDEDIFGEELILEASDGSDNEDDAHENKNKRGGPSIAFEKYRYIVVNVWGWPCVHFIYTPTYRPWISPYRYRSYPNWYRPWRPLSWGVWHPHRYHHHGYRYASTHRIIRAHKIYTPMRVRSKTVTTKTTIARNHYKVSRTKTNVKGPHGGTHTRTSTKVKTPKGTATKTKTTSRKGRRN